MNKMIVITFDNEEKAYEGANVLRELHNEGSISAYAAAVVAKDTEGNVSVKQAADEGPLGTAVGMLTGSMLGLFGGPAGVAVGMTAGALIGSVVDLNNIGINADFVEDVNKTLEPGKVAVVAECDESWVTPLDSRMEALGGSVLRRLRAGEYLNS